MSDRLHYIGKSNKDFTYDRVYPFYGTLTPTLLSLAIIANKCDIYLDDNYREYIEDNFRYVDENEYNKLIRKNKLKKISR